MGKLAILIFSGLTLCFTLSQPVQAERLVKADAEMFSGRWDGFRDAGEDSASLDLTLTQHDDKITGRYCYIARNGRRIDCPEKGEVNLQGSVQGAVATVVFDSSFGGKNGKAIIRVTGNNMQWQLTATPQGGEFYTPEVFDLTKVKSDELADKTVAPKTILDNNAIQDSLKAMLGDRYDDFINNFEVLNESPRARDGSIFIEGWMPHLAQENASALIVQADGNLFAAWMTPESDAIEYQSTSTKREMPDLLVTWAERFKPRHFAVLTDVLKHEPYIEHFETDKFKITLTVECGYQQGCNDAVYHGVRKKDGAELILQGKVIHADCKNNTCTVLSYEFRNGNVVYLLDKLTSKLTVIDNNKIVVDENGVWTQ